MRDAVTKGNRDSFLHIIEIKIIAQGLTPESLGHILFYRCDEDRKKKVLRDELMTLFLDTQ